MRERLIQFFQCIIAIDAQLKCFINNNLHYEDIKQKEVRSRIVHIHRWLWVSLQNQVSIITFTSWYVAKSDGGMGRSTKLERLAWHVTRKLKIQPHNELEQIICMEGKKRTQKYPQDDAKEDGCMNPLVSTPRFHLNCYSNKL